MTSPASPARPVVEVKRSADGTREQRFECEIVDLSRQRAVIRYRFEREGAALDSYGFFWKRRPYNCYYVVPRRVIPRGGGAPVFVRFDLVGDVEIDPRSDPAEVRYRDLLLDLWVDDRGARWEDEDELEAALAQGVIAPSDAQRLDIARRRLASGYRRVIREVRGELRLLGALASPLSH